MLNANETLKISCSESKTQMLCLTADVDQRMIFRQLPFLIQLLFQ